eukprot:TRINITY_DN62044_c0_g1_i1.p1 TRINITY_DN62044_c0_g1~~TRINITY_DN62044_c0_g1_i1.p1  ORF type:complete len:537 (+),score=73.53 TRINITY_DN62044_c0_g1_i1:58-1668(+)
MRAHRRQGRPCRDFTRGDVNFFGQEQLWSITRAVIASLEERDQWSWSEIHDAELEFAQFHSQATSLEVPHSEVEDLTWVFSECDRDGSGWIPLCELRRDLVEGDETFEELALAAACDKDGWVNYEKYLSIRMGGNGEWQDDSGYVPLRPHVYHLATSFIAPSILPALSTDADIPFVTVRPGVFTVPLLDPAYCRALLEELRHLDHYCSTNRIGGVFRLRCDSIGSIGGSDLTRRSAKAIKYSSHGKRLAARGFGKLCEELAVILRPICSRLLPRLCGAEHGGLERQVCFALRHWLNVRATSAALSKASGGASVISGGPEKTCFSKSWDRTGKVNAGDSSSGLSTFVGADFVGCHNGYFDIGFGDRYDNVANGEVPVYEDDSLVTISICLSTRCAGGKDLYGAARCERHASGRTTAPQHDLRPVRIQPGHAVVRLGCVEAATEPLAAGERYDLVMWLRHRGVSDGRQRSGHYSESGRRSLNRLLPSRAWCEDCADAMRMAEAALAVRLPHTVLQRTAKELMPLPDNVVSLVLSLAYG